MGLPIMYSRFGILLAAVALILLMPRASHAQNDCDNIDSIGQYWTQAAERLDRSFSGTSGLTQSEGELVSVSFYAVS
jgi:hypothetical protein